MPTPSPPQPVGGQAGVQAAVGAVGLGERDLVHTGRLARQHRVDLEALLTGLGVAGVEGGGAIVAGEARRLACSAGLVPAVLGGDSVPLDLGRERRLHNSHQRRALALVHETCAVTGCERLFAWCEVHHHRLRSAGGRTDLDNALPLCGWHHRRAHEDGWDLRRHSSGDYRFHVRR